MADGENDTTDQVLDNGHPTPYITTGYPARRLVGPLLGRLGVVPTLVVAGRADPKSADRAGNPHRGRRRPLSGCPTGSDAVGPKPSGRRTRSTASARRRRGIPGDRSCRRRARAGRRLASGERIQARQEALRADRRARRSSTVRIEVDSSNRRSIARLATPVRPIGARRWSSPGGRDRRRTPRSADSDRWRRG
jgi:hypothetical protein